MLVLLLLRRRSGGEADFLKHVRNAGSMQKRQEGGTGGWNRKVEEGRAKVRRGRRIEKIHRCAFTHT
jgi:hypothetical protein